MMSDGNSRQVWHSCKPTQVSHGYESASGRVGEGGVGNGREARVDGVVDL